MTSSAPPNSPAPSHPGIRERLAGRTILVTGATGFLAKALVAKILRDVPDVKRIVLLLRERRRGSQVIHAPERLEREVLGSSVFRRLRGELGEQFDIMARAKLVAIEGDLTRDGLGLSDADREIASTVDFVINSAATVVFDERLDVALGINTLGVRRLLELCRANGNRPLLHVSTAYVCGIRDGLVPETLPSLTRVAIDDLNGSATGTLDLAQEIAIIRAKCAELEEDAATPARTAYLAKNLARGEKSVDEARRRYLKDALVEAGMDRAHERGWNDTYTYTKSLGERVLMTERGAVPACIVRPAIIESSLSDPEPGWIDGLRMADPLFVAYGKGTLKRIPSKPQALIDFIPVDHVVNAMLAAAAKLLEDSETTASLETVRVYHVGTSSANPLRFQQLFELTREYFLKSPFRDRAGKAIIPSSDGFITEDDFFRKMGRTQRLVGFGLSALDLLPRGSVASVRTELGRAKAQVERVLYYIRIYGPYTRFPAQFDTAKTQELRAWLSEAERRLFNFDAHGFDWRTYIQDVHLPGLIRNVLREGGPGKMAHSSAAPEEGTSDVGGRTLVDLILEACAAHQDRLAIQVHGGVKIHFAELAERILGTAASLADAGVTTGDRVVLLSENRPEWPIAYFGIQAAGAIAVPLDIQTPGRQVREMGTFVGAKLIIASARAAESLPPGDTPSMPIVEVASRRLDRKSAEHRGLPRSISSEQAASILFTSGTTLAPKGVVLPHRCLLANVTAIAEVLNPGPDDRLVSVLPLHHAFEFTAGMAAPLSAGASITYLEQISAQGIVDAMRDTKATCLLGVPRLYELMLEGIERQVGALSGGEAAALEGLRGASRAFSAIGLGGAGRTLLSPIHAKFGGSVRAFVSGGAALDPRIQQGFTDLGFVLVEGYGLTECAPVVTVNPPEAPRAGSVGRPLPGVEVRIHHPGSDGVGEIIVRGQSVMAGYYKDPAATARVIRDGWFHTGDLGRFDEHGYLHVTGRLKDMIVTSSGKNVYPDEIESVLRDIAGVRELCVVGVRTRGASGEEVHLVLVTAADAGEPSDAVRAALRTIVAERMESLPTHQRVQRIHIQPEDLPKTALMKVKRGQVKARLEGAEPAGRAGGAPAAAASAISQHDPLAKEIVALLSRLTRTPAETIHQDQNLSFDLAVDSLMLAEIVAAIEARTGGKVSEEMAKDLLSVGELFALASRLRPAGPQAKGTAATSSASSKPSGPAPMTGSAAAIARQAAPIIKFMSPLLYDQYLRLEVSGLSNVPKTGAYIIAANHQSHLDAGAVLRALGPEARRVKVVAAQDYFFDKGWKGAFFSGLLNAIPFDRHGDFEDGLSTCRMALRDGSPLLIFPEGTRSPDGRMQAFKAGFGMLALELGVPIVPARIEGTHESLPKGSHVPRPVRLRVVFGKPMDSLKLAPDDGSLPYERYRAIAESTRQRILEMGVGGSGTDAPQ